MKLHLSLIFIFALFISAGAQDYPRKEVNLERLADDLFGFQDLDLNYEELYENLALLLANPVNINTATPEELRFLNILTEAQVQSLINYRTENGNLVSIYELQAVPGFDLTLIYRIVPFFTVEIARGKLDAALTRRLLSKGNTYFLMRYEQTLETKQGFTDEVSADQKFKGSEGKLYLRYRSSIPNDFSVGFTVEKDAGEQVKWNSSTNQYGFDYNSFHAQVMNKGIIKNLIVGDYQAQVAQGLLLGGSFGFGKGGEPITTIRRSNLGFLPYTSVNEVSYLRGAAITLEAYQNLYISGFYSNTWRDATLAYDTTEVSYASSLQTTGLHRNDAELKTRHKLNEQQYGVVLNYRHTNLDAGIVFNQIDFDSQIDRTPQPYNQFSFSGSGITNVGGFVNYTLHNFTLFTESGKTIDGGYGWVAGVLGSVTQHLDISLHYRNYQRNFYSLYSNAFAESSIPQNENGIYWGWKYRWNQRFTLAGYADLFRFPWLRYRSYAPSDGDEWLIRFSYQPSRSVLMYAQMREESKVRNLSGSDSPLYLTDIGLKRNLLLNCDYGLGQKLKLKTRAQFSSYEMGGQSTRGMTILQDISIDLGRISLTGRYALFDTDDYDNRQYVYERDFWLAYSMPAYSGVGVRSYFMAEYKLNNMFSFWLRWAQTRYTDRDEIGSGPDTIIGNSRNDIKFQIRIRI